MTKLFGISIALLLGVVLSSRTAEAQPVLAQRCNADSLSPAGAEARILWARRCALAMRIGHPDGYDPTPPGALHEYTEYDSSLNFWGVNSYIGALYGFAINYTATTLLYSSGAISEGRDALGYFQWFRALPRKKVRPLYPTYGSQVDLNNPINYPLYPHPTNPNDCFFYRDKAGTTPADGLAFYVVAYCEALL